MNLPSCVNGYCLHCFVNCNAVFWSVHLSFVISLCASHRRLDIRKGKRGAWKGRVVLVNTPSKASLGCRREGCPAVCALWSKNVFSVCFSVEVQVGHKIDKARLSFAACSICSTVHNPRCSIRWRNGLGSLQLLSKTCFNRK